MLRIVKLTFKKEKVNEFLNNFELSKDKIRAFEGCKGMYLLRDKKSEHVFFTYSEWEDEENLENYRKSELFKGVWSSVKPLFAEKAEAWSVEKFA